MDIVAALFVQGDAGGKVQRVALFLAACAQQHTGRADLLGVVGRDVAVAARPAARSGRRAARTGS